MSPPRRDYTCLQSGWFHTEVVRLLLQAGADPLAITKQGHTPIGVALAFKHPEVIALLRARIAEIQGPRRG